MKTALLTLGASVLFTVSSITTSAYAGPGHDNTEGGHMDHMAEGGHMGHMNTVLQRLKHELGDKYDEPVPAASKEQLVAGKKTFTKLCTTCHGESGKGDGPAAAALKQKPADFTDAEHSKFYSDQGRIYLIKKGSAGTAMPAWENILSEKEIQSVYAYVRSLRSTAKKEGHGEHSH